MNIDHIAGWRCDRRATEQRRTNPVETSKPDPSDAVIGSVACYTNMFAPRDRVFAPFRSWSGCLNACRRLVGMGSLENKWIYVSSFNWDY
jgi:hypothetical protein